MNCPVCGQAMVQENFGLLVQVCENGCKGIWFDHGELERLDHVGEGMGPALEAALRSPRKNPPARGQIKCPKCGIPMHNHKFARDQEVSVDECYACGGFFLDSGELKEIRDHYLSDEELKEYTDKIVNTVPGYLGAVEDLRGEQRRAHIVSNLTGKILEPTYWGRP
ncbi:MAG TPA: zf-TFIIB domain-containing protein [bacterium]|jgi:Zn-finger nucleic acid-binding protein|nr:zf-TFIIB domain-containing protein [bacterium]